MGSRTGEQRQDTVNTWLRAEARRPFDLSRGPLVRAYLSRGRATTSMSCSWVMHHIVTDGWSMRVLRRELSELYTSRRDGASSRLAEPVPQYADCALWERTQAQVDRTASQQSSWTKHLSGMRDLHLPTDRQRPTRASTYEGAAHKFEIDAALSDALRVLARREGCSLFMVLLGAFGTLLSCYSGQDDFGIGTPIAHRTRLEAESVVGPLLNLLVLRMNLGGRPTIKELLARMREETLSAFAHQDVRFEQLVELGVRRDASRSPLFSR